jgi:hypothetical protein
MKLYNRTTKDIFFNSPEGIFKLPASNSAGVDGPEVDILGNITARMVLSAEHVKINALIAAGSVRYDKAVVVPPH